MKEFILINYNLKIDKIYNDTFFINDEKIKIIKYKENLNRIEKLVKITNDLYYKNVKVNTFILNKERQFYTKKNNEYIILIKENDIDDYYNLSYLNNFNILNDLEPYDILENWKKEIDDIEEKIIGYNKEYKMVQKTANYYIGLAENAISLLGEINANNNSIGHKITPYNFNKKELNNPFNFIKINKMYNVSIYIKNKVLSNRFDYNELDQIINGIENDIDEAALFSYMLYPDYYIDLVKEEINENKIKKLIKLIPIYEKILIYMKENLNKNNKIKLFVWLN